MPARSRTGFCASHRPSISDSLAQRHPKIAKAKNKLIVLSVEKGQVRPGQRLSNIKAAFNCDTVEYLERLVSKLIGNAAPEARISDAHAVKHSFVEPQVRASRDQPPRDYSLVKDWLKGPNSGALILVGQGGIGKTWAMLDLLDQVSSRRIELSRQI